MVQKNPSAKTAWRRILCFCRTHSISIVLERMRATCGEAYFGIDIIKLDPRRDVLNTLVHELLHLSYPDMQEPKIAKLEHQVCSTLTMRQYKYLVDMLCKNIIDKKEYK